MCTYIHARMGKVGKSSAESERKKEELMSFIQAALYCRASSPSFFTSIRLRLFFLFRAGLVRDEGEYSLAGERLI